LTDVAAAPQPALGAGYRFVKGCVANQPEQWLRHVTMNTFFGGCRFTGAATGICLDNASTQI